MHPQIELAGLFPAETRTPEETAALGRTLAEQLASGDIVALYGDLGAGKTVFVRGICDGLGVDSSRVTSPTFTILHEYVDGRGRRPPVYHFDAYRIERIDEFYGIGYEEYFFGDGISIVEWAGKIEALLPDSAVRIRIKHITGDVRHVDLVAANDDRASAPEHA